MKDLNKEIFIKTKNTTLCGDKSDGSIPLTKGTVMEHSKLLLSTWFYTDEYDFD